MKDYITTAFTVIVGLLTADKLVYLALIGLGLLIIWQMFSLLFSFHSSLARKCRKITKFLNTKGLSKNNYNAFLGLIAKMPQEFIRGYKAFEHASYGLPSDYIKRFESIDVEVNGGLFKQGKSLQKSFIYMWGILLAIFSLALMGEETAITGYALADALLIPVLFLILARILYYIYVAIRQQQYRVSVDEFNEMLDIMNDKIENNDSLPGPDILAEVYSELSSQQEPQIDQQVASPDKLDANASQNAPDTDQNLSSTNFAYDSTAEASLAAEPQPEISPVFPQKEINKPQSLAELGEIAEQSTSDGDNKTQSAYTTNELLSEIDDNSAFVENLTAEDKNMQSETKSPSQSLDTQSATAVALDAPESTVLEPIKAENTTTAAAEPQSETSDDTSDTQGLENAIDQDLDKISKEIEDEIYLPSDPQELQSSEISEQQDEAVLQNPENEDKNLENIKETMPINLTNAETDRQVDLEQPPIENEDITEQNINNSEVENDMSEQEKRGRGRPKKLPEGELVITNDKQFEEVLERAEKLMRKSQTALSASQAKRVEKSLKELVDAMTKYKEQ